VASPGIFRLQPEVWLDPLCVSATLLARALPCALRMHPYPKHLDTFDYRGPYRYSLTFCTHGRVPLFEDEAHVTLVQEHFLRIATELGFADLAHCFMPDHLHALVEGKTNEADLRAFVSRAKQSSGFYFKKQFGVRLWQRYSYERVLRSNEATIAAIRYVLENPLRSGLVKTVSDYPFIGSSEYTRSELIEICLDRELPPEGGSHTSG
jgi:putative transposase